MNIQRGFTQVYLSILMHPRRESLGIVLKQSNNHHFYPQAYPHD